MGYVYFSDEQKQRANSVDLVDFLERQGERLTRSGREWRWKRHGYALVDDDDIHCLMIGAAGVGKTANFLYPNLEYACASGMLQ